MGGEGLSANQIQERATSIFGQNIDFGLNKDALYRLDKNQIVGLTKSTEIFTDSVITYLSGSHQFDLKTYVDGVAQKFELNESEKNSLYNNLNSNPKIKDIKKVIPLISGGMISYRGFEYSDGNDIVNNTLDFLKKNSKGNLSKYISLKAGLLMAVNSDYSKMDPKELAKQLDMNFSFDKAALAYASYGRSKMGLYSEERSLATEGVVLDTSLLNADDLNKIESFSAKIVPPGESKNPTKTDKKSEESTNKNKSQREEFNANSNAQSSTKTGDGVLTHTGNWDGFLLARTDKGEAHGKPVAALQARLKALGLLNDGQIKADQDNSVFKYGEATYGDNTAEAVRKIQEKYDLNQDYGFGRMTDLALETWEREMSVKREAETKAAEPEKQKSLEKDLTETFSAYNEAEKINFKTLKNGTPLLNAFNGFEQNQNLTTDQKTKITQIKEKLQSFVPQ